MTKANRMRFKIVTILLSLLVVSASAFCEGVPSNWRAWDRYPEVTRYSAERVQDLLIAEEEMVLIYAGYETDKVICGSLYLPYTLVPPYSSGSKVNPKISKDTWMVAYCP